MESRVDPADNPPDDRKMLACGDCGNPAPVFEEPGINGRPDTGRWISIRCECGGVYYICERDYVLHRRYLEKRKERVRK